MLDEVLKNLTAEMEGTITAMRRELARTRTGRASTALLEGSRSSTTAPGRRSISSRRCRLPEPRLLVIQPFDRSVHRATSRRAILQSDLGLMPANDGKIVRVPIPELTEERRRELVKHVRKVAEEFRVSLAQSPPRRQRDAQG